MTKLKANCIKRQTASSAITLLKSALIMNAFFDEMFFFYFNTLLFEKHYNLKAFLKRDFSRQFNLIIL